MRPTLRALERRAPRRGARGYVAAIILVLVTLGALAGLLAQLNAIGVERPVDEVTGGGLQLNEVRDALLAWSAANPERPGGLPCPDMNGDGIAEATCDTEAQRFGLLPWQTIKVYGRPLPSGLPGPPTADGEMLWYAVAPSLRLQTAYPAAALPCPLQSTGTANFAINPDSVVEVAGCADRQMLKLWRPGPTGVLVAGDVAAIVLAPGLPLGSQTRPLGTVDLASPGRYFEGRNAAARNAAPSPPRAGENTFDAPDFAPELGANDRIAVIRSGELLDVVEPAIEQRLRSTAFWDEVRRYNYAGASFATGFSFLPFPVPFSNPLADSPVPAQQPTPSPVAYPYDVLDYPGAPPTQGLFPVGLPPSELNWAFNSVLVSPPPTAPGIAIASATPDASRNLAITLINTDATAAQFAITLTVANAARGFLQPIPAPVGSALATLSAVGANVTQTGKLLITFTATVATTPLTGTTLIIPAVQLNPALAALTPTPVAPLAPTGWFIRNQWYRFVFYTPAPRTTPNRPSGNWAVCPSECLTVTFPLSSATSANEDVALVLTGRALPFQNRIATPNDPAMYLDTTENRNGDAVFEYRPVRNASNDRITYDPR